MDDQVKPRHAKLGLISFWGPSGLTNSLLTLVRTNVAAW
jgi:hypothetical protein